MLAQSGGGRPAVFVGTQDRPVRAAFEGKVTMMSSARFCLQVGAMCALLGACSDQTEDPCGLAQSTPDVASGTLQATRDGSSYVANSGLRGYRLADRSDIISGDVTLNLARDKDGRAVQDAVNQGRFPVCVLLTDNQAGNYAFVNASGTSFQTDGSHTGAVLLLRRDGDELVGRFAFEAAQNGGSATTRFEDGAFRLGTR